MIRTLILDDEPLALKLLSVYVEKIPDMELIAALTDPLEAKAKLGEGGIDCLFSDINMPELSGMELVRQLENPPFVIFTTAYKEYAVEGFRVNAIDYLVKPYSFEEFSNAVDKVRKQMELHSSMEKLNEDDTVLFFKVGHQTIRILASRILYVESMGAYLKVHTVSDAPFIVLGNFKSVIDAAPEQFIRSHKSYAVNINKVRQCGKSSLTLTDGTNLPVGDAYSADFLKIFSKKD